ncbi:MAG: alpha/beta fold hydrolase [Agriterribacter sp.]
MNRILSLFLFVLIYSGGNVAVAQKQAALLFYMDAIGKESPVHTPAEWEIKRTQVLSRMQLAMGALPDRVNLPTLNIQYTDSVKRKGYTRYTIYFTAAENENISAYLYVPVQKGAVKKRPAMLALHQTEAIGKGSVDGQGPHVNMAYAKELAQRGYIVIAPDYPGFGDQKAYDFKTNRYQSGTMKSIFDNMRCIDLLQSLPDVDPDRIGVIGHSLGGHNAIFTGAFDTRLKVIVSSCGWTLMHDYFNGDTASAQKYGGKLWPWAQERYMPLIGDQYGFDPDKVPFDFDEAIAAIAPRAFFSSAPVHDANFSIEGVKKGIANVKAVYDFLDVPQRLQVCYPDCQHDFPLQVRSQVYDFIDSVFGLAVKRKAGYSYADNPHYFKRMELFAAQKEQKNIVMLIDLNGTITDGKYLLKQYAIEDGIHYTAATYSLWGKEIVKIAGRLKL